MTDLPPDGQPEPAQPAVPGPGQPDWPGPVGAAEGGPEWTTAGSTGPEPAGPMAGGPEAGRESAGEPGAGLEPGARVRSRQVPRLLGYLAAAVAGGVLVGGLMLAAGLRPEASPVPSPTPEASPSPEPDLAGADRSIGRPDAPVTLEIWADYQCPFCRLETFAFGGPLEREFVAPGTVRIVYRDYAFLGQESIDAAVAARCAGRQTPGAYWRYHDLLFVSQGGENQGVFVRQNLLALARVADLDEVAFTACLDDATVREAVTAETAQGGQLGISSTPTMRVIGPGGTQVMRGFSEQWSVLREAIARAAASPAPSGSPARSSPGAPPGSSPGASAAPTTSSPSATPAP